MTSDDPVIVSFRWQADICQQMDSPLTALLLKSLADDLSKGGITRDILPHWDGDPNDDALPLRFAGALHYAVLTGNAARLAGFYPNVGGRSREDGFWEAAEETIRTNRTIVDDFLKGPPQTNEVRRSAVLLGGFLTVAQATGLPLRCLEIAASAGLNLNWDSFYYSIATDSGERHWGNPDSPVQLQSDWRGPSTDLATEVTVVERAGCDISPIDLSDPDTGTRMSSYIWPDQLARFHNLTAAIEIARENGLTLERADAADWAHRQLRQRRTGTATVIYHSIAQHYFSTETRDGVKQAIEQAGAKATDDAPIAWLRMELPDDWISMKANMRTQLPELRLRLWPGGEDRLLATVHPHGNTAQWIGDP
ncbi:MAG: DUF2332 domain-containing protein [Alphaproteobacteria bacterium]